MPATSRAVRSGCAALGERPQRLALEVEQPPSRARARRGPGRGGSRRGSRCSAGQLAVAARLDDVARPPAEREPSAGTREPSLRHSRERIAPTSARGRPAVASAGGRAPAARAAWTSAVATPRSRARAVKSSPAATARERHAPGVLDAGDELLREREVAVLGIAPSAASQAPLRRPIAIGTRSEPCRGQSAACTTTSGFSPGCRVRKTLTINGSAVDPRGRPCGR